jgi:hypothetical protein
MATPELTCVCGNASSTRANTLRVFQLVLEELAVDVTLLPVPDEPDDVLAVREHDMVLLVLVVEALVVAVVLPLPLLVLLLPIPLLLLLLLEDVADDVLPLGAELMVEVMEVVDELPLVDGEVVDDDIDDTEEEEGEEEEEEEEEDAPPEEVLAAVVVEDDELVLGPTFVLEDVTDEGDDAEVSEVVL